MYIKGGSILPLRSESANTTAALRTNDFTIIVAPGSNGTASGSLYLDEGNNIDQPDISEITFEYSNGVFSMDGQFGYDAGVSITSVVLLASNSSTTSGGSAGKTVNTTIPLTTSYSMSF